MNKYAEAAEWLNGEIASFLVPGRAGLSRDIQMLSLAARVLRALADGAVLCEPKIEHEGEGEVMRWYPLPASPLKDQT